MAGNARTRQGRKPPDDKYLFGTQEEVSNRNFERGLFSEFDPTTTNPAFVQIPPSTPTGKSINRAPIAKRAGHIKFAGGPGTSRF